MNSPESMPLFKFKISGKGFIYVFKNSLKSEKRQGEYDKFKNYNKI